MVALGTSIVVPEEVVGRLSKFELSRLSTVPDDVVGRLSSVAAVVIGKADVPSVEGCWEV